MCSHNTDTGGMHTSQEAKLLSSQGRTHSCTPSSRGRGPQGKSPSGRSESLFPPAGPQRSASSGPGCHLGLCLHHTGPPGDGMGDRGNAQEQKPLPPGPVPLPQLCDPSRSSNLSGPQQLLPKNLGWCPPQTALLLPRAVLPLHCRPPALGPYPQRLVGRYGAMPPHSTSW